MEIGIFDCLRRVRWCFGGVVYFLYRWVFIGMLLAHSAYILALKKPDPDTE